MLVASLFRTYTALNSLCPPPRPTSMFPLPGPQHLRGVGEGGAGMHWKGGGGTPPPPGPPAYAQPLSP